MSSSPGYVAMYVYGDLCSANEYVSNSQCNACPAGTVRACCDVKTGGNTACVATSCAKNFHVVSNSCVRCPSGQLRPAGDLASGVDTFCEAPSGTWSLLGAIISGERFGDYSGVSVSISDDGTRMVIGATHSPSTGTNPVGHARVFEYNVGSGWSQLGVDIDGTRANGDFGHTVVISGDGSTVAIGEPNYNVNNWVTAPGAVHVYKYDAGSNSWIGLGQDYSGNVMNTISPDNWGAWSGDSTSTSPQKVGTAFSLTYDGTIIAVGAPEPYTSSGGAGSHTGEVMVFQLLWATADQYGGVDRWQWTQISTKINYQSILVPSGAGGMTGWDAAGDIGTSVSLSSDGTTIAVGLPFTHVSNTAG